MAYSTMSVPYHYRQGRSFGNGPKLPVFMGLRSQRGGNFFGSIFRTIGRFALPAWKFFLPTLTGVAGDLVSGRSFKQSVKDRGSTLLAGAIHKGVDKAGNIIKERVSSRLTPQKGSGRKRRSTQSKSSTKRRKVTKKSKKCCRKKCKKQTGSGRKKVSKKKKTTRKQKGGRRTNLLF